MILAGLFIWFFEFHCMTIIVKKYSEDGNTLIEPEEFIFQASLEDIIKVRYHALTSMMGLAFASIASIMRMAA